MSDRFHMILIRPSRYDEDGYIVQWRRLVYPFLGLSVLNALVEDCAAREILGKDVKITVEAWDDQCGLPRLQNMISRIRSAAAGGLVGIVGAQSAQFPRGADLARRFRSAGIPVIMGGFHVSGCHITLPELPRELKEMLEIGVSLFVGEAEGRLDGLIKDVSNGCMKPVYDYGSDRVDLEKAGLPAHIPKNVVKRMVPFLDSVNPIEAGRGCPHNCSFCTVIHVHGRKTRARDSEDVAAFIRKAVAEGKTRFLFTDDNLARNPRCREILKALVELREEEGLCFSFMFQTDTLSGYDPDFVALAVRAGCAQVFIGMESIDPEALASVGKHHNVVKNYQRCFMAWKRYGVVVMTGYIVGFPGDTPESVRRDIETIKRQLPVDMLYPFIMTPLPGSTDYRRLWSKCSVLDPDLSRYTTCLATTPHPRMTNKKLEALYREVWQRYYDNNHTCCIIRRHTTLGGDLSDLFPFLLVARGTFAIEKLHPFEMGILRIKSRKGRRPGFPVEPMVPFYIRRFREVVVTHYHWWQQWRNLNRLVRQTKKEEFMGRDPALVQDFGTFQVDKITGG